MVLTKNLSGVETAMSAFLDAQFPVASDRRVTWGPANRMIEGLDRTMLRNETAEPPRAVLCIAFHLRILL